MANETNLFNKGTNGFTSDISLGGLPIFTEDIQNIQTNYTELYGLVSLLKGSSCILRGCLIDDLNVAAGTCSITEGVVLLEDTIYYIPAQSTSYPFAITKGAETNDTRIFKDGSIRDVAIAHSYAITTSFTYPAGDDFFTEYPDNISLNSAIYFNPFTHQKAEYILNNRTKGLLEIRQMVNNISNITKTETGKSIVGGVLSAVHPKQVLSFNNTYKQYLRWKYAGWFTNDAGNFIKAASNSSLIDFFGGKFKTFGADFVTLNSNNLPAHNHSVSLPVNFTVSKSNNGVAGGSNGFLGSLNDGNSPAGISGNVDGNSGNNLTTNDPISTVPKHFLAVNAYYEGFVGQNSVVSPYASQNLYYPNM